MTTTWRAAAAGVVVVVSIVVFSLGFPPATISKHHDGRLLSLQANQNYHLYHHPSDS
jgi:hypothetical protein